METAVQQLVGEDLLGGGKAGQKHPAQQYKGKEDPQGQKQITRSQLQFPPPADGFTVSLFFFTK